MAQPGADDGEVDEGEAAGRAGQDADGAGADMHELDGELLDEMPAGELAEAGDALAIRLGLDTSQGARAGPGAAESLLQGCRSAAQRKWTSSHGHTCRSQSQVVETTA